MTVLPLWPNGTPEPPMTTEPEKDVTTPQDNPISGHRSRRLANVTKPTLSVFPPAAGIANTGTAALVFPGGGYVRLAWDGEGLDTCKWLNSIGVTCLLVKYRVPYGTHYPENPADLEDAQQAMRLSRLHAAEWHIDPHRIGAVGFSAGAHLAVALGNHPDDAHVLSTPAAKSADADISGRPDFAVVIYPGYLTAPPGLATLDPAEVPTSNTPPTFLYRPRTIRCTCRMRWCTTARCWTPACLRSCTSSLPAGTALGCSRRGSRRHTGRISPQPGYIRRAC